VKSRAASGRFLCGNPGADSILGTENGIRQPYNSGVPASANFHLSAKRFPGEIRTDIPIVIEETGQHSLRAHMGSGGGRVDVHTGLGRDSRERHEIASCTFNFSFSTKYD